MQDPTVATERTLFVENTEVVPGNRHFIVMFNPPFPVSITIIPHIMHLVGNEVMTVVLVYFEGALVVLARPHIKGPFFSALKGYKTVPD